MRSKPVNLASYGPSTFSALRMGMCYSSSLLGVGHSQFYKGGEHAFAMGGRYVYVQLIKSTDGGLLIGQSLNLTEQIDRTAASPGWF